MRDEAYRAAIVSILLSSCEENEKERTRVSLLLNHLRKIFKVSTTKHDRLLQECLKYRMYVLEVKVVDIPVTKTVMVTVESRKKTSQHTLNGGEQYEIDLGPSRQVSIHCSVVKLNGQKAKAVLRKNSLFRRMISDGRESDDSIDASLIPLNEQLRRAFTAKGTTYHAEICLTQQTSDVPLPNLEFEDLLDFVRAIHEFEALTQRPAYSGELQDLSYSLLHFTFIFYQIPSILLKIATLAVFLVWDRSINELSQAVVPRAIEDIQSHQGTPEVCQKFTRCMEHLFECVVGTVDELLMISAPVIHRTSSHNLGHHLPVERQYSLQSRISRSSTATHTTLDRQASAHSASSHVEATPPLEAPPPLLRVERRGSAHSTHSACSRVHPPSPILTRPSRLASGGLGTSLLGSIHNPLVRKTSKSKKEGEIPAISNSNCNLNSSSILASHAKLERKPSTVSRRKTSELGKSTSTSTSAETPTIAFPVLELPEHLRVFPPTDGTEMTDFHKTLRPIVLICALSVWDYVDSLDPAHYLATRLAQLIAASVECWVQRELVADNLDAHSLCALMQHIVREIYRNHHSYTLYFEQFSIDYLKTVYEAFDAPLDATVRAVVVSVTEEVDSRDAEQLDQYSKNTMKTYTAVGNLRKIVHARRFCPPCLADFEGWFKPCFVFWTTSWRETSLRMVERTISLEEDGVSRSTEERPLPSGLYSFLCIQKGLSDDVLTLQLEHPEHAILTTIKMVHIFCDNLIVYARKLYIESKSNNDEETCSTSCQYSRCVRAVNGIDHSVDYIKNHWKRFVDWKRVEHLIPEDEVEHILLSVNNILDLCTEHCGLLADKIVERVCMGRKEEVVKLARQLCLDRHEYTKTLASYVRDRIDAFHNVESIIAQLEKTSEQLERELYPKRCKMALRRLHVCFEHEVSRQLKEFQCHEYYRNIYVALKIIREVLRSPKTPSEFFSSLYLKSLSTEELILAFYGDLADMSRPQGDEPELCLQTAYIRGDAELEEHVTLLINIREARLPEALHCPSDLCCRLELLPKYMFQPENFPPAVTKAVPGGTTGPKWAQAYQIIVPQTSFFTNGAVLCISVVDRDRLGCDKILGRAIVALNQVPETNPARRRFAPRVWHPLLPPSAGSKLEFFSVLRERSLYDSTARKFWKRERMARELQIGLQQLKQVPKRLGSLRRIGSEKLSASRRSLWSNRGARTVSTL